MSARAAARLESLGFSHVYRYVAGKLDWLAFDLPSEGKATMKPHVRDLMRRDAPTCDLAEPVSSVRSRLDRTDWEFCVVVNDDRVVEGLLPLAQCANDDEARQSMQSGVHTFRPYAEVKSTLESMRKGKVDHAVVTNSDGQLLGALLRVDAEKATTDNDDQ